jgi:hypothetical protein
MDMKFRPSKNFAEVSVLGGNGWIPIEFSNKWAA